MSKFFTLNRRTLLKGAGGALALPWLESMESPLHGAERRSVEPRRMVLINVPLSFIPSAFFPTQAGKDYVDSDYLKILREFRQDYTVISGLHHPGVDGGHGSQSRIFNGTPSNQRMGISIDQFAAQFIGRHTRFDTLPMAMSGVGQIWSADGSPVRSEQKMSEVFQRLFSEERLTDKAAARKSLGQSRSILDLVNGQAQRMKKHVSKIDGRKLDEFFNSVRELELRLKKSESWLDKSKPTVSAQPPVDPGSSSEFITKMKNLFDVAYLALATDSTRIITYNIFSQNTVNIEGVNNGYHSLTHHGRDPENLRQLQLIETEIFKNLRDFLARLKSTQEDDSTLLDRTSVLLVSNLGDAARHYTREFPVLLAGGRFKHGSHLVFDPARDVPLSNIFVSMLQQMEIEADSFGTSTGTLSGLKLS